MPSTNFQTIHQMGSAINSFVKQATGRDNVQNIDMEHITVAQNHYYEDVDISGRVVSFNAGAAGIPLDKCLVQIEPVQEGTGDQSPDNVRPISGWTKAKVFVSPTTDEADGTTYIIAFPSEAGTVYGGTLDVTTGELVVDHGIKTFTGAEGYSFTAYSTETLYTNASILPGARLAQSIFGLCNMVNTATNSAINSTYLDKPSSSSAGVEFKKVLSYWGLTEQTSAALNSKLAEWYANGTPLQIVYELAAPITYQLTPQEVRTLLGQNNIWADTGDIEVKFKNIKEFF